MPHGLHNHGVLVFEPGTRMLRSIHFLSLEKQMKLVKAVLLSLVAGLAIGMWLGVNIGREVPLYSNPFNTDTLNQKLKRATGETLEKGGHALEQAGQNLKDKLDK